MNRRITFAVLLFFAGVDEAAKMITAASIRMLRNEAARLPGGLMIYGVDDPPGRFLGAGRVGAPPEIARIRLVPA